jgi:hypothetical protein
MAKRFIKEAEAMIAYREKQLDEQMIQELSKQKLTPVLPCTPEKQKECDDWELNNHNTKPPEDCEACQ